jgi:hypothetical protein
MNWKLLLLTNVPRDGGGGGETGSTAGDTSQDDSGGGGQAEAGATEAQGFGFSGDLGGGGFSDAIGPSDFGGFGLSGPVGVDFGGGFGPSVSAPFGGQDLAPEAIPGFEGAAGPGLGGTSIGFSAGYDSPVDFTGMTPTSIDVAMEAPVTDESLAAANANLAAQAAIAVARDLEARAYDAAISAGKSTSQARADARDAYTSAISSAFPGTVAPSVSISPTATNAQAIAAAQEASRAAQMATAPAAVAAPTAVAAPAAVAAPSVAAAMAPSPPSRPSDLPDSFTTAAMAPSPPSRPTDLPATNVTLADVLSSPSKLGSYLDQTFSRENVTAAGINIGLSMVPGVGPAIGLTNLGLSLAGQPTIGTALAGNIYGGFPDSVGRSPAEDVGFEGSGMGIASLSPGSAGRPTEVALAPSTVAPVAYNLADFSPRPSGIEVLSAATPSPAFPSSYAAAYTPAFVAATPSPNPLASPLSRPQYV